MGLGLLIGVVLASWEVRAKLQAWRVLEEPAFGLLLLALNKNALQLWSFRGRRGPWGLRT